MTLLLSLLLSSAEAASLSVAYLGEFALHPGLVVGIDHVVARKGPAAFVVAGNVGGWVHARNHVGVFADGELGFRLTSSPGFLVEAFAGAGYLHTFLASPTWVVDDKGPTRIVDAGRPAFMPTASLGFGWELDRVTPFLRFQAFGQYPFNHYVLPHFAVQIGARF